MNLDQSFPSVDDFKKFGVVSPTNAEIVRQSLYDYAIYPTAGLNQVGFFANPIGQGIASAVGAAVGSSKTYADTNIELSSQLPQGKAFWIETIEIVFYPGTSAAANTYTPAVPSLFAAAAAAAVAAQLNDVETLRQSGFLEVNISSKNYLRETPAGRFPPKVQHTIDAATANTSATTGEIAVVNGKWTGRPYIVEPAIVLQSGVNFDVTLKFPGLVATPSGFNGRIGVILDGYLLRAAQ